MNCPSCGTVNEKDNSFCVGCGEPFAPVQAATAALPATMMGADNLPPTQFIPSDRADAPDAPDSVQTNFRTTPPFDRSMQNFYPSIADPGAQADRGGSGKVIWFGALAVLLVLLIGGGIAAIYLTNQKSASAEVLPDHLGMFVQNTEKTAVSEISKQDYASALTAKDDLLKNESLPTVGGKSNLLLYADGRDVPLNDLKLIQLDTIRDDGTLKQISYQAAPVEGKPEIKRLRVADGLANGKYAFALFEGFLDEGKHKFWAFQVKNGEKTDNGDLAKALTLTVKPKTAPAANANLNHANTTIKTAPTPKPEPSAPAGARVAYCASSNVVMRGSPSLTGRKVNALRRGQKIYVINYSENSDYWNGMEGNWAYVQTESGSRGWVFTPLINY